MIQVLPAYSHCSGASATGSVALILCFRIRWDWPIYLVRNWMRDIGGQHSHCVSTRNHNGKDAALKGFGSLRRRRIASGRASAFTLVETLVAMGVVGILVGALYSGITFGTCSIRSTRENLRATQIMIEKMEVIRLLSWDQVVSNNVLPATFVAYYDPAASTNQGRGVTYTGSIEMKPFPAAKTYQPEMKQVTVQVQWVTGSLKHSRRLTSYVAHYGIQNYVNN